MRTKVLLLSATPVNNDLKDLRNQLYVITAGNDQAFQASIGIGNLGETLRQAQMQFTNWAKRPAGQRKTGDLLVNLGADFFTLLDELTIARRANTFRNTISMKWRAWAAFPSENARWPSLSISIWPDVLCPMTD